MAAPIEFANSGLRELCGIQRQVGKRHDCIVATMVEENGRTFTEPGSKIYLQPVCVEPFFRSPVRSSDKEDTDNF
jgi:hypothetical protein